VRLIFTAPQFTAILDHDPPVMAQKATMPSFGKVGLAPSELQRGLLEMLVQRGIGVEIRQVP
jgi:hypothetical protein